MAEETDTSPPEREARSSEGSRESRDQEPERRHAAIVWTLVVIASLLVVVSITANWVQRETLDTDEVASTTDEMLEDEDVQDALSTYTVDQLYANVDVQGEIEKRLPSGAQALAAPVAAATRQLAVSAEKRALATPQVQELVSNAVAGAQRQLVNLIESKDEYVSTTGGEVTLEYGSVVADLAARLGVDPATISNVQNLVQQYSQDLRQGLESLQSRIKAAREGLRQVQQGELSPEAQGNLETLSRGAADLQTKVASVRQKLKGAQGSVPSLLQDRFAKLEGRLAGIDAGLSALEERTTAVLQDPSQANVEGLDASLGSAEQRVETALERQVVQTPGQLVLMNSNQLDGVQSVVSALRNLGFVLPLLALVLYAVALYLAKGWRRRALIAVGGGILIATLLVLMLRRLIGSEVVGSLASSDTVEPAIGSVWDIISEGLRQRALFVFVVGLACVGGGLLAGPSRHAVAARRFLAPHLREHPVVIYAVLAVLFLLWLAFAPGFNNVGQILAVVVLAILAVVGVEILRRQTAREFPGATSS